MSKEERKEILKERQLPAIVKNIVSPPPLGYFQTLSQTWPFNDDFIDVVFRYGKFHFFQHSFCCLYGFGGEESRGDKFEVFCTSRLKVREPE